MDGNKRKRPVKKPENPVREWISDNLRYIMLFGGIALAVVIVVFAVRAFTGGVSSDSSSIQSSADTSINSGENDTTQDVSGETNSDGEDQELKEDNSGEQNGDAESESGSGQEEEAALEPASEDITNVVSSYLNALAQKDADAAASVMESMTAEDRTAISQGGFAESYNNLEVHSYPGDTAGAYVVFATYDYTYPGYGTAVPALTQFYVITRDDGSLCIASEQTQESKAEYMNSLLTRVDVAVLINTVQTEYEAALASDPALAEYINSLSGS